MKAKLTMLIGVSGVGKSAFAKQLKDAGEIDLIISSDALRAELFGDENDQNHNNELFNELHNRIRKALKEGKRVCYDATNLSSKRRIGFLKNISDLDIVKECIVLIASFDLCVFSQSNRERQVPVDVIKKQIKQFQCPYWYEGWDDIRIILRDNVSKYAYMSMNNMPHHNSHHELNIDEHMNKTSNICKFLTGNKVLREAALYHDLGKFFCKEFDILEEGISEAHYYGHQNASAYFYLNDLANLGDNGIGYCLEIAVLIQYHMEPFLRNEKGLERLEKLLGYNLFCDLMQLHQCDKLAH
ncbi:MAG: ATP-binding protein [Clostridiales bacterium]|nr:ATP-binding protein [Clostridiales bacterium]